MFKHTYTSISVSIRSSMIKILFFHKVLKNSNSEMLVIYLYPFLAKRDVFLNILMKTGQKLNEYLQYFKKSFIKRVTEASLLIKPDSIPCRFRFFIMDKTTIYSKSSRRRQYLKRLHFLFQYHVLQVVAKYDGIRCCFHKKRDLFSMLEF